MEGDKLQPTRSDWRPSLVSNDDLCPAMSTDRTAIDHAVKEWLRLESVLPLPSLPHND